MAIDETEDVGVQVSSLELRCGHGMFGPGQVDQSRASPINRCAVGWHWLCQCFFFAFSLLFKLFKQVEVGYEDLDSAET